jgi:RNase P subunit RPR2
MKKLKELSIKKIKKRLIKDFAKLVKGQSTFLFCNHCDTELISSNSFVSDKELVSYKCVGCGTKTKWNFDIAPVPIRIEQ